MNICLVSNDHGVDRICREALATLPGQDWNLVRQPPEENQTVADVYVWDLDAFPDGLHEPTDRQHSAHILLLQLQHLPRLNDFLKIPVISLLLKPLNRDSLAVVLKMAVQHVTSQQHNQAAESPSDNPQKDEIFHCLLQVCLRLQQCQVDRMNFLARALHDLRSPLTAISGYCSLLGAQRLGRLNPQQQETLQRMQGSVQRLASIAEDAFRFCTTPEAEKGLQLQPTDVEACLEEALNEVTPLAEAKNISISCDAVPPRAPLNMEAVQITRVLVNLLENASKFTLRHGSIRVRASSVFWERSTAGTLNELDTVAGSLNSRDPNAYRIDVVDSGRRIAPQHLSHMFEPDSSYSGSNDRAGAGLSLATCKLIINGYKGEIFASSDSEGATFSVVLPYPDEESACLHTTETTPLKEENHHVRSNGSNSR